MGDNSAIEWTDATWNPVRGCSIVSKGCTNCYAMKQAHRSSGVGGAYEGLTKLTKGGPVWTGEVTIVTSQLSRPIFWRRPRRIFVNSMSDLFHEGLNDGDIDEIFAVMAIADHHQYQVLTKRPQRMLRYLTDPQRIERIYAQWPTYSGRAPEIKAWPLPNVWLGVSVEDQASADERIPLLLQTPAAVRWISAEPLLGPIVLKDPPNDIGEPRLSYLERVDLADQESPRIDWVVAGGESGHGARPVEVSWVRSLRDQCRVAGVPFFFKQWGNWLPAGQDGSPTHDPQIINASDRPLHTTKKAAGRQFDGRTHDDYPDGAWQASS